jgi:anti-sigma factor RsiW
MTEMTHERCSQLLASFARGELSATDQSAVERHLATCAECSREYAGVNLFLTGDHEGLTDHERARLHNAVGAAMARSRSPQIDVFPVPAPGLRERLWPGMRVLAAAAIVVVGFVFAANVLPGGNDTDSGRADIQGAAGGGASAPEAAPNGPAPVFAGPAAPGAFAADQSDGAATEESASPGQALRSAKSSPPYSTDELRQLGRTQAPFTDFAASYTGEDVSRLAEPFLEQLAASAPTDRLASAVRTCGREVLDAASIPLLPAFAAYEVVEREQSLVFGLVSSSLTDGPVDQYRLWVWSDGDCDLLTFSSMGRIKPRR